LLSPHPPLLAAAAGQWTCSISPFVFLALSSFLLYFCVYFVSVIAAFHYIFFEFQTIFCRKYNAGASANTPALCAAIDFYFSQADPNKTSQKTVLKKE